MLQGISYRARSTFSVQRSAFSVQRLRVQRSAFSVQRSTFSVQRSAFNVQRSTFGVQRSAGAVRTSVTLLVQYMGNTLGLKVTCFRVVGLCKFWDIDPGFGRGSFGLGRLKRTIHWRLDLSIIAPGRCAARMPGTGTLRRSSGAARKKAIVGKSLVEAHRLQRPGFVFRFLVRMGSFLSS